MSEIGIKDQCFGVEVEMTGISRRWAAEILAKHFGAATQYLGTYYDTWGITDPRGKVWKLMSDSSIDPERRSGEEYIPLQKRTPEGREFQVELVSPKLTYAELPKLQDCVRALQKAGAGFTQAHLC